MFKITAGYTDQYQLTMAQSHFINQRHNTPIVCDYFFRKLPFKGGFAIFAGLTTFIQTLQTLQFSQDELSYLSTIGFDNSFLEYLETFQFSGNIFSLKEGEVMFPNTPILRVECTLLEACLIETFLLNILNFQSLIATKASRLRLSAPKSTLIELGLRRAQGLGGYWASRAAYIGGIDATSNIRAGIDFNIPTTGTMAHSYIQSFDSEISAFRHYASSWPDNCVLLLDTYNTLKSGIPNAILVAKELEQKGHQLKAVRLDSGDLNYLSNQVRQALDKADLPYVKIIASNQLDEHVIASLISQGSQIDVFGIGTSLSAGLKDAALDGVFKISQVNDKDKIKCSDSLSKASLPGKKFLYRLLDANNKFWGLDLITNASEKQFNKMINPFDPLQSIEITDQKIEPLLHNVMKKGKLTIAPLDSDIHAIKKYTSLRLEQLPLEYKRFEYPHRYKVSISPELLSTRDKIFKQLNL